jgi:hypothetical protein
VLEDRHENADTRLQLLPPMMMIYSGYGEHTAKTRISHVLFMEETDIIAKTKEQPLNQLKTPLSISIRDSDLTNVERLYSKRES